jgi:Xaa-Pro dipeptidase
MTNHSEPLPTTPTGEELDLIRGAAELVAVGHRALRDAIAPGVTEHELWSAAQAAMAEAAGAPVVAIVDLMSGPRTELIGEPPTDRVLRAGDAVLFDLAPRRDGWWADSCATIAVGPPSAALRRRHDAVLAALEAGLDAARTGARTSAVDAAIRGVLAGASLECPHHTGHGVGAAAQQAPWLRPGEDAVLEAGTVLALEPGAYADGLGVRLEHLAVVTDDGARPLTTHSLDLR